MGLGGWRNIFVEDAVFDVRLYSLRFELSMDSASGDCEMEGLMLS